MKPSTILIFISIIFTLEFLIVMPIISDSFTYSLMFSGDAYVPPSNFSSNIENLGSSSLSAETTGTNPLNYLSVFIGFFSFGIFLPDSIKTEASYLFILGSMINYIIIIMLIIAIYMLVRGIG